MALNISNINGVILFHRTSEDETQETYEGYPKSHFRQFRFTLDAIVILMEYREYDELIENLSINGSLVTDFNDAATKLSQVFGDANTTETV